MSSGAGQQPEQANVAQSKLIKAPQDFLGGLLIMAIAAFAVWLGRDLDSGTLGGMGPGMMPRSAAVLLGALGAALTVCALIEGGPKLEGWTLRGPFFVLLAIVVFAYAIRPLGLAVAAPLAILVSGLASNETRWGETMLFSITMTAFCVGLFKFALRLPVPLAPWLLGY
jgi:putative tricarboxylic transport membrane protein